MAQETRSGTGLVLVVDDNERNRELLSARLEMNGYTTLAAEDGAQAIDLVDKHAIDLVLLDVMMPGLDGFEVLKILRETRLMSELPVIMVTAKDEGDDVVKALNLGANDYVTKPIDFPVLMARMQAHLLLKRSEEALREANESLEKRVEERTADLKAVNERLRLEIDERKQMEEANRQLERHLIQSERMASVGTVAAGIVHNLRSPLMGIFGFGQLIQAEHPNLKWIDRIVSSAQQMDEMIEGILGRTRQKLVFEQIDLNALLARELDFLQAGLTFKHEGETDIRLAESLPPVTAVYTDISQVFANLLRNAVEAMYGQKPKRLTVSTASDAHHVAVEITDTGSGIPESDIPQLFEPFFTTKSPGDKTDGPVGTGLGLFTVKRILETYHAEIEIKSEAGSGTTFRVTIPIQPPDNKTGKMA